MSLLLTFVAGLVLVGIASGGRCRVTDSSTGGGEAVPMKRFSM